MRKWLVWKFGFCATFWLTEQVGTSHRGDALSLLTGKLRKSLLIDIIARNAFQQNSIVIVLIKMPSAYQQCQTLIYKIWYIIMSKVIFMCAPGRFVWICFRLKHYQIQIKVSPHNANKTYVLLILFNNTFL